MGIQMKKILLAGVAGIALVAGAPAHAADLRARRPPPPPPPPVVAPVPVFSWTGCYIGANIGGAWAHGTVLYDISMPQLYKTHSRGGNPEDRLLGTLPEKPGKAAAWRRDRNRI